MTEEQKVANLLKRRYKVMADYPGSKLRIGDILEDGEKEYEWWINNRDQSKWTFAPANYPEIFDKLNWWDERKPGEMPGYVRVKIDIPYYGFKKGQVLHMGEISSKRDSITLLGKPLIKLTEVEPTTYQQFLDYNNSENKCVI